MFDKNKIINDISSKFIDFISLFVLRNFVIKMFSSPCFAGRVKIVFLL